MQDKEAHLSFLELKLINDYKLGPLIAFAAVACQTITWSPGCEGDYLLHGPLLKKYSRNLI